jgi:ankyrin repeat protein
VSICLIDFTPSRVQSIKRCAEPDVDEMMQLPLLVNCRAHVKVPEDTSNLHVTATLLIVAATYNRIEWIKSLCRIEALDLNARALGDGEKCKGKSALQYAASYGHNDVVQALLACSGLNVNARGPYGSSALHWAVDGGHVDVVRAMLECAEHEFNVNLSSDFGETPLVLAVRQRRRSSGFVA